MTEWAHKVAHIWKRKKEEDKKIKGESTVLGISDKQVDTITMSIADSVRASFQRTRFKKRKTP